jgi:hypothetical protein
MKQIEKIINKINEDRCVDNFWAIQNYILRLSSVINALKKRGWSFEGKFLEGTKNYCYYIIKRPLF